MVKRGAAFNYTNLWTLHKRKQIGATTELAGPYGDLLERLRCRWLPLHLKLKIVAKLISTIKDFIKNVDFS